VKTPKSPSARAAFVAIFVAAFLAVVKFFVGFLSGSLAILASGLDSALDTAISTINFFVIHAAEKPADREHPFGHGKFEAFAEFFQSLFLIGIAIALFVESMRRFLTPRSLEYFEISIGVMLFSVATTFFLSRFLKKTAAKTGSLVVKSDTAHYESDLFANLGVIFGLLAVKFFGFLWLDAAISAIIAGGIFWGALGLLRESFEVLTDKEISKKERQKIINILNAAKKSGKINGWHLLRTRRAGAQTHIDAHLVFENGISLFDAHEIGDALTAKILQKIPRAIVLFHFDPRDDFCENLESLGKKCPATSQK